jgi:hypothetical protein
MLRGQHVSGVIVEHKHTPGQFSGFIGIVAAYVYVLLEQPL